MKRNMEKETEKNELPVYSPQTKGVKKTSTSKKACALLRKRFLDEQKMPTAAEDGLHRNNPDAVQNKVGGAPAGTRTLEQTKKDPSYDPKDRLG